MVDGPGQGLPIGRSFFDEFDRKEDSWSFCFVLCGLTLQYLLFFTHPSLQANISLEMILGKTDTKNRQTKIICTLGPACWDVPTLEALIREGLSVARFNFSHGDHEGHKACLDRLREAMKNTGQQVGTTIETMTNVT